MIHFVNVVHKAVFEPRARRREDKTEAILDAAMRLCVEGGLEAITLQKVASELGIVTTALYRYFASKDALVAALQRRAVAAMHAHFTAVRAGVTSNAPLAPILALARAYVAMPTTHTETFRLVAILLGDPRTLVPDDEAAKAAPLVGAILIDMQSLFAAAEREGALEPGDPLERTLILWASLHGLTQLEKLRRVATRAPTANTLCDETVTAILRGFGAEPQQITRAKQALKKGPRS